MASELGGDSYNLKRFIEAQEGIYESALAELKKGLKRTHWMWFIFPQIDGLGFSEMSHSYAIKNLDEARQYLAHPILSARLRECCEALLQVQGRRAIQIFGSPDDLKLRSSMTLFALAGETSPFEDVLRKYFNGQRDPRTVDILAKTERQSF